MLYVNEGYILLFHDMTRLMPRDRDCHRFWSYAFYNIKNTKYKMSNNTMHKKVIDPTASASSMMTSQQQSTHTTKSDKFRDILNLYFLS